MGFSPLRELLSGVWGMCCEVVEEDFGGSSGLISWGVMWLLLLEEVVVVTMMEN